MRILITGNMGYVGPIVVAHLRKIFPDADLIGFDTALFATQMTTDGMFPERLLSKQVYGDVRDIERTLLEGVDAIIHLSAISNDPMGSRFEAATKAINCEASLRLAEIARAAGVSRFVFASSCSVYGSGGGGPRKETDELRPLTTYAWSKIATERALEAIAGDEMIVTCLRFATACGMSPRLRLDLVLNDFVANAFTMGEIKVLSDGMPWRPLIDVSDMARAVEWAIARPADHGGHLLTVNVGADDQNYRVRDLADAVAAALPGTTVSINAQAPPDGRSYQVDFGLFRSLAPNHQPKNKVGDSISLLVAGLRSMTMPLGEFRHSDAIRFYALERHIAAKRLDSHIRWCVSGLDTLK